MRYIVKFERLAPVRFISHLELMKCLHKALRRAEIDVMYTEGFNPQIKMSFAFAMPVGLISRGEYFDIRLKDGDNNMTPAVFCEKLNKQLPNGIKVVDCKEATDKTPHLSSLTQYAQYDVIYFGNSAKIAKDNIDRFNAMKELVVSVPSKKGFKEQEIKKAILSFTIKEDNRDHVIFRLCTAMSETLSVKASVVAKAFTQMCGLDENEMPDIIRTDFFSVTDSGIELSPLDHIEKVK